MIDAGYVTDDEFEAGRSWLLFWQVALAAAVRLAWEWAAASGVLDSSLAGRVTSCAASRSGLERMCCRRMWGRRSPKRFLAFAIGGSLGVVFGFALAGVPLWQRC